MHLQHSRCQVSQKVSTSQSQGVVAFFSAKDIPKSQNTWGPTIPDEEVFTSSEITYFGQTIGIKNL